jgi:hypothetical protein
VALCEFLCRRTSQLQRAWCLCVRKNHPCRLQHPCLPCSQGFAFRARNSQQQRAPGRGICAAPPEVVTLAPPAPATEEQDGVASTHDQNVHGTSGAVSVDQPGLKRATELRSIVFVTSEVGMSSWRRPKHLRVLRYARGQTRCVQHGAR